jgi:hypothetical protein
MWTRAVSEEKERLAYPFGILPGWAVGWKLAWAGLFPTTSFTFFPFFSLFLFSFSFVKFAKWLQIDSDKL